MQRLGAPGADRHAHAVARQRLGGGASQAFARGADKRDSRHTRADRSSAHGLLPVEIIVGVIEPVLADRGEDIELERVVERFGLMVDP
jgi:hypothetical protein